MMETYPDSLTQTTGVCVGHALPFLKQRTPGSEGSQVSTRQEAPPLAAPPLAAQPRPTARPGQPYLSQRAQLHDDPDGVLCDDADQLHNVRVIKLTHGY